MTSQFALVTGSLSGLTAVLLGAFGAHGLRNMLMLTGRLETFNLAVEYQFYHALALLLVGLLMQQKHSPRLKYAVIGFFGGIVLFSGSLYMLALLDKSALGAVTPFGGVLFVAGWVSFLLGILHKKGPQ
jgi:uncharacterized membrane protein YgdD (TMEM256/DUF423 family)